MVFTIRAFRHFQAPGRFRINEIVSGPLESGWRMYPLATAVIARADREAFAQIIDIAYGWYVLGGILDRCRAWRHSRPRPSRWFSGEAMCSVSRGHSWNPRARRRCRWFRRFFFDICCIVNKYTAVELRLSAAFRCLQRRWVHQGAGDAVEH